MVKNFEDMQKVGKDSVDASMQSFEQGSLAAEKLVAAKSFDKVLEIQTDYAKTAYEGFVAQATKFGQLYADLAQETFKPFESQWAKATAK